MPTTLLETRLAPVRTPARSQREARLTAAVIAVPAVVLLATAIARWVNGKASIDLVVLDQGLWALSRGRSPWAGVIGETLLEDHFGPGILVFGVLYRLAASPVWLITAQTLAGAAAAWLVARRLLDRLGWRMAGAIGAGLLISPPVAYALLFDVHSVVFAVPFALAGVFALEDGAPRRALVFGMLAACFRVEIGLAVLAAFAVWPGPRRARLRAAAVLGAYLLVAFVLEKRLGHDSYWPIHYGHLGSTAGAALRHPARVLGVLFDPSHIVRAVPWLGAGAFLALRRPRLMLPAGMLALPVLLSRWPGTGHVVFQYGLAPTFLLALAWIPQLRRDPRRALAVPVCCGVLALMFGPLVPPLSSPDSLASFAGQFWRSAGDDRCMLAGIPPEAGISGGRPITRLAHREHVYLWPFPFAGARASVLPAEHLQRPDPALAAHVDYVLVRESARREVPDGFTPDGAGGGYLRFRRTATTEPGPAECRAGASSR
jgi:uncharacterized membrane protein